MSDINHTYCVIMAGGVGSRFWPMSRQQKPKQFLDILGTGKTLLQQTVDRFERIIPRENIFIVTHKSYFDTVMGQIKGINPQNVLLEPSRRNTAPCVAYAIAKIEKIDAEANIIVAPSDHLILKEDIFIERIQEGIKFISENKALLTLGIKPSRPDTGYGYIQYNHENGQSENSPVKKVKTFTEKPNLELAKSFLSSGEFLWNSGIFMASIPTLNNSYSAFLPEMQQVFEEGKSEYYTESEKTFIEKAYARCTNISIDYGIMEKAQNVYVIPSEFGWSDLGTWGSLYDNSDKDDIGNVVVGKNVLKYNTTNCIINVPKEKLVVVQGLDDFIVVESDGILLICKKQDEQEIKQMVNDVKARMGEDFV
jgi:mannose-1-phosphate guanylyltransferase